MYGKSTVDVVIGDYCGDFEGVFELSYQGNISESKFVENDQMHSNTSHVVQWDHGYGEGIYCTRFVLTHLGDGTSVSSKEFCHNEVPLDCEYDADTTVSHKIDHNTRMTHWTWMSTWNANEWCWYEGLSFELWWSQNGLSGEWENYQTNFTDWCNGEWCNQGSYEIEWTEAEQDRVVMVNFIVNYKPTIWQLQNSSSYDISDEDEVKETCRPAIVED